jgi:hypothetical protein
MVRPKPNKTCPVCGIRFYCRPSRKTPCTNSTCSNYRPPHGQATPFDERLWSRILCNLGTGCWEWQGALQGGYGIIGIGGAYHSGNGNVRVHRHMWERFKGPIPKGLFVCHTCDNPRCCRPGHLFLGTCAENLKDMTAKGRRRNGTSPGEANSHARLTEADVFAIRERLKTRTVGMVAVLAREYGISYPTMNSLANGQTWRHLL